MTGKRPDIKYNHAYWGPKFSNREIEDLLIQCKIKYKKSNNIAKDIAELITKNKIVGWFQGEMEVGPRALGNRSILADPRNPEMKDKVNDVKGERNGAPLPLLF